MTLTVTARDETGGPVVALHGVLDATLVEPIADGVTAVALERGGLVVDVSDVVLASPAAFTELVDRLSAVVGGDNVTVACDRLSGRRLMRLRCQLAAHRIFADVDQALASLRVSPLPAV